MQASSSENSREIPGEFVQDPEYLARMANGSLDGKRVVSTGDFVSWGGTGDKLTVPHGGVGRPDLEEMKC